MRSSGALVVIGLLLVLAPASPAIAQSSGAPGGGGDPVLVAQRSDDHAIVVVDVPAGAVHPEHETRISTYLGSAELGGSGDDAYRLTLEIQPEHTGSGSMSLSETLWTVDAYLQRDPSSTLPALPERANDTVRETIDEVSGSVDRLDGRVPSLQALLEELDQAPGPDSATVNTTVDLARERLEVASGLVEQVDQTVDWLASESHEVHRNATRDRVLSGEVALRLVHALVADTARLVGDGPQGVSVPGPGAGEQRDAFTELARETARDVNDTWHGYVGWALAREHRGYGVAQNRTDHAFSRLAGWAGYGDDRLETTRDVLAELAGEHPVPAGGEDGSRSEDGGDGDGGDETDGDDGGLPLTLPTVPTEHTTYRTVRENFTELSRPLPSSTGNYSRDRVNRTADAIQGLEQGLRFLAEDWLAFAGIDPDEPGSSTTEDVRDLVDAARSDLETARDALPTDGGGTPDGGEGGDAPTLRSAVETAWERFNESREKVDQARRQAHEATLAAGGEPGWLVERADAVLSRPTQVRVWVPLDTPTDGDVGLPDGLDDDPTVPDPDDGPSLPSDRDDVVDVDHEGSGDDAESTADNGTSAVENQTPDHGDLTEDPSGAGPSTPVTDSGDGDDGSGDNGTDDGTLDGNGTDDGTGDGTDDGSDQGDSGDSDGQDDQDGTDKGDDASDDGSQSSQGHGQGDGQTDASQGDSDQAGGSGGSDQGGSQDAGEASGGENNQQAATGPELTVDPGQLRTETGRQKIVDVRMRNTADGERTYHVTVTEDAPVAVDSPGEGERTLAPGQTGRVRLRVSPTGPGDGTLGVVVSGPEGDATKRLPVHVGQAPGGANRLEVDVDPLNLRLATGETGRLQVAIENVGGAARTVDVAPWTRGPVQATVEGSASVEVPAGQTVGVPIELSPQAEGLAEVPIKVTSDQGDQLRPVALLSIVGSGQVDEGRSTDLAANQAGQPSSTDDEEEENGVPFPAALAAMAALGSALAVRGRRNRP